MDHAGVVPSRSYIDAERVAAEEVDSSAMTSRLSLLRSRLVRLSRMRALLRTAAAGASIGSSVVIADFVAFAIDFSFRLQVAERLLVIGEVGVAWSMWRYACQCCVVASRSQKRYLRWSGGYRSIATW